MYLFNYRCQMTIQLYYNDYTIKYQLHNEIITIITTFKKGYKYLHVYPTFIICCHVLNLTLSNQYT